MSNDVIPFDFEGRSVRVVEKEGMLWFVMADVSQALGYRDAHNAARNLDDEDKGTHNMSTLGGSQEMSVINESGLYSLIFGSRKAAARRFKRWVTSEVLPTIRKTGQYSAERVSPDQQELRMKDHFKLQRKYIAVLDELEHYRRSAETWDKATALVKAGVDNDTICTILKVPLPYLEWVRCRAEVEQSP